MTETNQNPQLLFAKKEDILTSISQIYDSLIDITEEVDKLHTMLKSVEKNQNELTIHVGHLRSIISKDLTIRGVSPHMLITTLRDLKMSQDQWQKYINSSSSPSEDRENSTDSSHYSNGRRTEKKVEMIEKIIEDK